MAPQTSCEYLGRNADTAHANIVDPGHHKRVTFKRRSWSLVTHYIIQINLKADRILENLLNSP